MPQALPTSPNPERDITADLRGALPPVVTRDHAAILEPARIGELMRVAVRLWDNSAIASLKIERAEHLQKDAEAKRDRATAALADA